MALLSALAPLSLSFSLPLAPCPAAPSLAARCSSIRLTDSDSEDESGPIEPLLSLSHGPGIAPMREQTPAELQGDPRLRQFDVGPFSTSIGIRDGRYDDPAAEPDFLEREDWHISSTFSPEALVAAAEEEAALSVPLEKEEVDRVFLDEEYEYVRYDKGSADRAVYAPKHAMPRSWQEYQALQARVEAIAGETIGDCTAQERAQANEFMQKLQEFYPSFKSILAEGCVQSYACTLARSARELTLSPLLNT